MRPFPFAGLLALAAALTTALTAPGALATDVEVSVSSPPTLRFGLSGVAAGENTLSFGVSNRALDFGLERRLDLSVAGTASLQLSGAYAFSGGLRAAALGRASVGPVALNLGVTGWTVPLSEFDPLVSLSEEGGSLQPRGYSLDLSARYRLRRDLQLLASGNLGQQPNVAAGVEWRRGAVSLRGGARVGEGVLGATFGATLRQEDFTLAADALLGPGAMGLTGSLNLADPLQVPSNLRLYAAYEPWRMHVLPVRLGASLSAELGQGEASLDLRAAPGEAGLRLGYRLPLDAGTDEAP